MHGPGAGDLGRLEEAHIAYLSALASRRAAARTAGRVGTQPQGCQGRSCSVVWGPVWDGVEKTCGLQDSAQK